MFSRLTGRGKKDEEKELEEPPVGPASRERRKYIPGEDGDLVAKEIGNLMWKG